MTCLRTLQIREWSTVTSDDPDPTGSQLRGLRLTDADRELLAELKGRATLKITELRSGLAISVKQHIGTVNLSCLRLVVMPKIRIDNLMRMVAYAFDFSDLLVTEIPTTYRTAEHGLIDLLGLSLLRAVERIARGGLLPNYQVRNEDLSTPRGRLDMRHISTHPRRATLRCTYDDLTVDHALNQLLAAGLRFAAAVMQSADIRLGLARAADRFFGDLTRVPLDAAGLRAAIDRLDRRSSHYQPALTLVALIHQGTRLGKHADAGAMPLTSFMLDMNKVFERFLGRYFRENAPQDVRIATQESHSDVFRFLENSPDWRKPRIQPDFIFRRRGEVIAVADAKYKNRSEHRPNSAELYQLTTYGLALPMPEPREVLLLHPLASGDLDHATTLIFAPPGATQQALIRLVGVPVDRLIEGTPTPWWPLPRAFSPQTR